MANRIRRVLRKLIPFVLLVLIAISIAYFASRPTELMTTPALRIENFAERELWADGSDNVRGSHVRRNFYEADRDKHPDFGIVYHVINCKSFLAAQEKSSMSDAISVCRQQFGGAYRSESLLAWDDFGRHKNEWRNGVRAIPFSPKWIVIILDNQAKLPRPGANEGEEMSETARTHMIEVGYIFPADKIFDKSVSPSQILPFGFRDAVPLKFDFSQPVPADQTIYSIIEKFKREEDSKIE